MNQLLQRLRSSTHSSHERLDRLIPGDQPASDIGAYTDYLTRFRAGLSDCWKMLDWSRLSELGLPDVNRREGRYHALASDLDVLGHPTPAFPHGEKSNDAATVGCLYVLEGSIHGGRVLLNQIEEQLSVPADALKFLRGFGAENGRMWAEFTKWLESLHTTPEFLAEAESAAVRSFEHFIQSFEHPEWTH